MLCVSVASLDYEKGNVCNSGRAAVVAVEEGTPTSARIGVRDTPRTNNELIYS